MRWGCQRKRSNRTRTPYRTIRRGGRWAPIWRAFVQTAAIAVPSAGRMVMERHPINDRSTTYSPLSDIRTITQEALLQQTKTLLTDMAKQHTLKDICETHFEHFHKAAKYFVDIGNSISHPHTFLNTPEGILIQYIAKAQYEGTPTLEFVCSHLIDGVSIVLQDKNNKWSTTLHDKLTDTKYVVGLTLVRNTIQTFANNEKESKLKESMTKLETVLKKILKPKSSLTVKVADTLPDTFLYDMFLIWFEPDTSMEVIAKRCAEIVNTSPHSSTFIDFIETVWEDDAVQEQLSTLIDSEIKGIRNDSVDSTVPSSNIKQIPTYPIIPLTTHIDQLPKGYNNPQLKKMIEHAVFQIITGNSNGGRRHRHRKRTIRRRLNRLTTS